MASAMSNTFCVDNKMQSEITKNMFLNEEYADFFFLFNEDGAWKRISAHKAVLAATSDVLATMLKNEWKEKHVVEIDGSSFDVFK